MVGEISDLQVHLFPPGVASEVLKRAFAVIIYMHTALLLRCKHIYLLLSCECMCIDSDALMVCVRVFH